MPSTRRKVIVSMALGGAQLATGCLGQGDSPKAGSLVIKNQDNLPHITTVKQTDSPRVGPSNQYEGIASVSIEPESQATYDGFLTKSGEYSIRAFLKTGAETEGPTFEFAGDNAADARYLQIVITPAGGVEWVLSKVQ